MPLAALPEALPASNRQLAGGGGSCDVGAFCRPAPRLEAGTQLGPSHPHPGPAEEATNCRSHGSSRHVARGQVQAASGIDLFRSPSKESPEPTHPVAGFRQHQSMTQLAPKVAHPKDIPKGSRPCWVNSASTQHLRQCDRGQSQ